MNINNWNVLIIFAVVSISMRISLTSHVGSLYTGRVGGACLVVNLNLVFIFFGWKELFLMYVLWSRNFLDGFILSLWYFKVLFNSNPLFIFKRNSILISNSVYFCIRVFITRNILTDLKALRNHCQEAYLSLFFYCWL